MAKDSNGKNYKDTLNLPKTAFDMRAGLVRKEPVMLEKWAQQNAYAQVRAARSGAPAYILHDGPPYANGNIHTGHLLNKVLKDMVVRYKTMTGFDAPYIPGWDCHGLPIEAKVMEKLGSKAAKMERSDIRKICRDYARKFITLQSEQFQRLGVWGDFDNPYITMDPAYEADVLEVFARMIERGVVYRQLKPVHWSIENRTALADAELEYHDREDTSIYVLLNCVDDTDLRAKLGIGTNLPLSLMIWTTTPWTLPANMAVAVHPEVDYCAVEFTDENGQKQCTIVAEKLVEKIFNLKADKIGSHKVIGSVSGVDLVASGVKYIHPVFGSEKTCPVVTALYVTIEDGCGLVHTAPGHGVDDYHTGLNNGLDIYCPVLGNGCFDDTVPEHLVGVRIWKANDMICDRLQEQGALFFLQKFTHSYPHDWRSKKPTIFRATEQWFIAVDRELADSDKTLRKMAQEVAAPGSDIRFIPEWGRKRLAGMLDSRPDWCISRQRSWGLPIPAFVNEVGEVMMTSASVRAVADYFAANGGSDCWFTDSPEKMLAKWDFANDSELESPENFSPDKLQKQWDIFDVWFESGSSWSSVAIARGLVEDIPVDLYLEGSDQHRGWFQLSLLPGLAAAGKCPFKSVLTHGFVVDENGYKMSKSVGNTIDVQAELKKRGADVMRLWVSSVNYQDDIKTSDKLIAQIEDAYRKIRNTLRFAMGSCFDFNPAENAVEPEPLGLDDWMSEQIDKLTSDVLTAYEQFEFHRVYRLIYEFCTVQASSIYMAAIKDRLYCDKPDSPRRRAAQTVLHRMLLELTRLLAPILPFTAQEAWTAIEHKPAELNDNIHLTQMPAPKPSQRRCGEMWDILLSVRDRVLLQLEALRATGVKNSLDSELVLTVAADDSELLELLGRSLADIEDMLGVGYARLETGDLADGERIGVSVADAREKYPSCARSWKRRPDVGSDTDYPDLSARDAEAVKSL